MISDLEKTILGLTGFDKLKDLQVPAILSLFFTCFLDYSTIKMIGIFLLLLLLFSYLVGNKNTITIRVSKYNKYKAWVKTASIDDLTYVYLVFLYMSGSASSYGMVTSLRRTIGNHKAYITNTQGLITFDMYTYLYLPNNFTDLEQTITEKLKEPNSFNIQEKEQTILNKHIQNFLKEN